MTEHTYRDTTWRAFLMGSEGWAVFAGPKMLASHLTEEQARLVAAAPNLLKTAEALLCYQFFPYPPPNSAAMSVEERAMFDAIHEAKEA